MIRFPYLLLAAATVVSLAGCGSAVGSGGAAGSGSAPADPGSAAAMCAPDTPDCTDTVVATDDEPVAIDETGVAQARRDAQAYLGVDEAGLPDAIRVARRGAETFALTEDYMIGRITVELDEADGAFVVSSATVELPDGPETFTAE
jgi:hypothetical protein